MRKRRCCSICQNVGHNSRTCKARHPSEDNPAPVATSEDKHSVQLLNLMPGSGSSTGGSAFCRPPSPSSSPQHQRPELAPANNNSTRKVPINKGVRWSREEHLGFVKGVKALGKGAWKSISERFVRTRTANQISSHAQKFFKRMKNPLRKKRHDSIFDVGMDEEPQDVHIPYVGFARMKIDEGVLARIPSPVSDS